MIRIEALTHVYPGGRRQPPRTAVADLTLHIPEGRFTILSGPNGSGKSTLFRILCGLARPSRGRVLVAGRDLLADPAAARARMGVVFQSPAVDKHLSVQENLSIHAALYGLTGAAFRARLDEALGWTDLDGRLGDRVDTLSGGLARQVELAKCLLTRPRLLLLDEPTTGLDPASRRSFLSALTRLRRERGMTVLMTSHIFSEAEDVDSVAIMANGRLLAHDTPQALRARLNTDVLVIDSPEPDTLVERLRADLGVTAIRHGDELRVDEPPGHTDAVALLERVLKDYRPLVRGITVKQPALEDVFIHVTAEARAARSGATPQETAA
ncbi:ABC transporter ATP-binding protein [Roseospira marina]|uniref:ABC transporter ATP-binding protein n=1 Tax=Roseospira marina TaxID=140057 RepID=A0A5M6IAC8_9PROT|nr:ABC transporter ATP-binding protein [Roseospira marina]KAA5604897.1 ABC transporter ATP-binding protein [Roseospira marina]MBB4315236.1 ABC-2 type transport system ATP-binding protein [Roseospira marina]MBB5088236.1 ABC-2 type transport system ATP-binding protein [Roseospira marina]